MRGDAVALKDIVLSEEGPEVVDLHCGEALAPSDEEEDQVVPQIRPSLDLFYVEHRCPFCGCAVIFACGASGLGIRTLQDLLVESDLVFICTSCARRLHHG
ncbi:E7 [Tadarida brasiliensis papillomavirus 2]|nr:E7 [Tadarida brasiliensis papillomavirus 2]